jgi:hypothetical protein
MGITTEPAYQLGTDKFIISVVVVIGAILPVAAVAVLPQGVFDPAGRSATLASVLILYGANMFYSVTATIISMLIVFAYLGFGFRENIYDIRDVGQILTTSLYVITMIVFIIMVLRVELQLSTRSAITVAITAIAASALLVYLAQNMESSIKAQAG